MYTAEGASTKEVLIDKRACCYAIFPKRKFIPVYAGLPHVRLNNVTCNIYFIGQLPRDIRWAEWVTKWKVKDGFWRNETTFFRPNDLGELFTKKLKKKCRVTSFLSLDWVTECWNGSTYLNIFLKKLAYRTITMKTTATNQLSKNKREIRKAWNEGGCLFSF